MLHHLKSRKRDWKIGRRTSMRNDKKVKVRVFQGKLGLKHREFESDEGQKLSMSLTSKNTLVRLAGAVSVEQ